MKRLVYSPHIQAFINSDDGVVDISPYIIAGRVNRKVNQVSSAQLTLRNPISQTTDPSTGEVAGKMIWTEHTRPDGSVGPRFHPMDPIIIILTRIADHPIQVFTGYVDKSPYLQLFPGPCTIEASCSLKKLLYVQWDAALPFVQYFLAAYGWAPDGDSGIVNPTAIEKTLKIDAGKLKEKFTDGSIGALIQAVLVNVCDWDNNAIWIEGLPPQISDLVIDLYRHESKEAQAGVNVMKTLISKILSNAPKGTGAPIASTNAPSGQWLQAIFPKGTKGTYSAIDEGVDLQFPDGTPIRAPGSGKIVDSTSISVGTSSGGHISGLWLTLHLDQPMDGYNDWYMAESIGKIPPVGTKVTLGQQIGIMQTTQGASGCETGWAAPSNHETLARANGHNNTTNSPTPEGAAFARTCGLPPSVDPKNPKHITV